MTTTTTTTAEQRTNPDGTPTLSADPIATIEAQWLGRVRTLNIKRGTAKYRNAEQEYFVGAIAALAALGYAGWCPPSWFVAILRGSDPRPGGMPYPQCDNSNRESSR